MKSSRIFYLKILITITLVTSNCKVDIRQLPPPREFENTKLSLHDLPVFIGRFEVFTADRIDYLKAWQYMFKATLKNNRIFSEAKDASKNENVGIDSLIIIYKYSYNYWWT
ncbi:hypothetical protein [Leptospira alstonii]|uniref:hypothetical protein n=1 Tax=Leptospira alstonii TaxID=28452 RepID=UPI000AC9E3E9|nr:hypothetical protein [Leptospira alstonii]